MRESRKLNRIRLPLLLTGTIDSSVYNNVGNIICDIEERLKQYEESIEKYIRYTPFNIIVFIENSGYAFDENKYKNMAKLYNKDFEFISGKICKQEILEHGKSFGDAYLIEEALKKSKLLENVEYFYKITGRIFLKNSYQVCKTSNKYRNEFIVYQGRKWCLTNIFKANKEDYLSVLKNVYLECDEKSINDIEYVFYKRLIHSNIEVGSFATYPYLDGKMGANGINYSGGFVERRLRNIMARFHFFTMNSFTAKVLGKMWH